MNENTAQKLTQKPKIKIKKRLDDTIGVIKGRKSEGVNR